MAGAWGLPVGRHSHMKNRERKDSFLGFMQNDKNWWYLMSFIPKKCGDLFGIFCNGGLMKFERNKLVRNPNPNTTQIQSRLPNIENIFEKSLNNITHSLCEHYQEKTLWDFCLSAKHSIAKKIAVTAFVQTLLLPTECSGAMVNEWQANSGPNLNLVR